MEITPEMREAVRTALAWPSPDAIIAAVAPLILEEAAKVAEANAMAWGEQGATREFMQAVQTAREIAAAIRALTPKP